MFVSDVAPPAVVSIQLIVSEAAQTTSGHKVAPLHFS